VKKSLLLIFVLLALASCGERWGMETFHLKCSGEIDRDKILSEDVTIRIRFNPWWFDTDGTLNMYGSATGTGSQFGDILGNDNIISIFDSFDGSLVGNYHKVTDKIYWSDSSFVYRGNCETFTPALL
jgi:hypothetical protein